MIAALAACAVGFWLTAAPQVLGYGRPAAISAWIAGPLIATFAGIAVTESTRGMRWANLAPAAWLLAAPLLLGHGTAAALNSVLCGAAVAALSFVRGRMRHRFDGGWSMLLNAGGSRSSGTGAPRRARRDRQPAG
ncbi:MAG TPA: SPW repeat protein [Planctomycetota bacterium]|nr:SPW repeat protein [Planctomycetota bacterium]